MKNYKVGQILNQVADAAEGTAETAENQAVPVTPEELEAALNDDDGKPLPNAEAVRRAVQSNAITVEHARVTRKVEGKPEPVGKDYIRFVANNLEGALALMGGKEQAVWDKFNVGYDMNVRSTLGQQIIRENEGPEKYIASAAKQIVKAFPHMTLEAVTEMLKQQVAAGTFNASAFAGSQESA